MDVAVLQRVDAKSFLTRKFVNSFKKGNSVGAFEDIHFGKKMTVAT